MRNPKTQDALTARALPNRSRSNGGHALPIGSAASILIHGGLLFVALYAWQVAPRIMPEDVIAVDMVADTQSTIGPGETPETAQQGVETQTPSPLPQQNQPALEQVSPITPLPTPKATPMLPLEADAPAPTPVSPTSPAPATKALPQPIAKTAPLPTPRPAPSPTPKPLPKPLPNTAAPKATTKAANATSSSPARAGPRQAAPSAPPEFDLAAASSAATGADSGGRRAPQLAARGQAGRLGAAGGGTKLTGDLEAALRRQIQPCWLEPADLSNPRRLLVEVSIDLGIDGRLLRDPVLVTPSSRAGADASLVVAIDNALRAVRQCAPYNLPPDRYETWRQVRFSFDPRRMSGTP